MLFHNATRQRCAVSVSRPTEMRRGSSKIVSSPLLALALFLLVCCSSSFHCAAAARLLPAVPLPPLGAAVVSGGDELSAASETMVGAEACENDECMQRRLLLDAHLDYIYTQHKGKP